MIPGLNEIRSAIRGASRLFMRDPGGLDDFDQSIDGFWKSFAAPIAAWPAYVIYVVANLAVINQIASENPGELDIELPGTASVLIASNLSYIAALAGFPALMALLAKRFGLSHRYVPFIIAWNWTTAVLTALLALPGLLYLMGVMSAVAVFGISFLIIVASLASLYFVAFVALQIKPPLAVAVIGFYALLRLGLSDLLGQLVY